MIPLWQLQQRFASAVVSRHPHALHSVLAGDPVQSAARTAIYINNHHIGLREALIAVYPVTRRLVGDDCFDLLARKYVCAYAKPSGNVLDFGAHLADEIERTEAFAALPYLADVARLEWLRHQVWHAADANPATALTLAALAALDDHALAALRLQLVPAARLFQSRYPVLQIWHANQALQPPAVDLDEGGVKCLVARAGLELEFALLPDGDYAFLAALDELPACAAAEQALSCDPDFDLALALRRWLGWLQLRTPGSAP